MWPVKWKPGCPCCDCASCSPPTTFEDHFDSSSTDSEYDTLGGTWEHNYDDTGESRLETFDADAVRLIGQEFTMSHWVSGQLLGGDEAGGAFRSIDPPARWDSRLMFAYLDADNFLFVQTKTTPHESTYSSVDLEIGHVIDGVSTIVETKCMVESGEITGTRLGVPVAVLVTWADGKAYISGSNGLRFFAFAVSLPATNGTKIGLASLDNDAAFNELLAGTFTCEPRECGFCSGLTTPAELHLDFSGVTNGTQSDAAAFNDSTFVLTRPVVDCEHSSKWCVWELSAGLPSGIQKIAVLFNAEGGPALFKPLILVVGDSSPGTPGISVPTQSIEMNNCVQLDCGQTRAFDLTVSSPIVEYSFSAASLTITPA